MSKKQIIWIGTFSFLLISNLTFLAFNFKNRYDLNQNGVKVSAKVIERVTGADDSYFYEFMYLVDGDWIQNSISSLNYYEVGEEIEIYYNKDNFWVVLLSDEVESNKTTVIQFIFIGVLIILIVMGLQFPNLINELKDDNTF